MLGFRGNTSEPNYDFDPCNKISALSMPRKPRHNKNPNSLQLPDRSDRHSVFNGTLPEFLNHYSVSSEGIFTGIDLHGNPVNCDLVSPFLVAELDVISDSIDNSLQLEHMNAFSILIYLNNGVCVMNVDFDTRNNEVEIEWIGGRAYGCPPGRFSIALIENIAREIGITRLFFDVYVDVLPFYEGLGFICDIPEDGDCQVICSKVLAAH